MTTSTPRDAVVFGYLLLAAALTAPLEAVAAEPTAEELKFFESQVRPLLVENCHKCHGEKKQNGGLRLDGRASILAGGESGPAIVPGKPQQSLLVEAITWQSLKMPPTGKLKPRQIAALTKWVEMGAPWPSASRRRQPAGSNPEADASGSPDPEADASGSAQDRQHWAFQPVRDPEVPEVADGGWSRNAIDRFIYRKLQEAGLQPAPEADRPTLIRRVTYDLIGLPPTPEEIDAFAGDGRPRAWERLIDRLLESPRYGERWGQHWLDLVRYAESDGFRADHYRPNAWRYRDYVIRAFNDDKPYDRFVAEQLAGDEIAPHDPEALIATGFLRHGIYEYNQRDVRTQWSDILNEITDVTGDVFLAMGMGCARCHNHKFDPILQKDYYRLQAFFTPILPQNGQPVVTPEQRAEYDRKLKEWEEATAAIRARIAEIERPYRQKAAEAAIVKFPDDVEAMIRKPPEQRKPFEHQLAELAYRQVDFEYGRLSIGKKDKEEWEQLKAKLKEYDHLKPDPLPVARTVRDVSATAPPTFIPDKERLGEIEPGFLSVLNPEPAEITPVETAKDSTGRRAALARWITDPENPLTARVMVNRIWQHHFGQGLVATESDFGRLGEPPSHPELLDWLATRFVESGWSIKAMHRLMLNTAAYRQRAIRQPVGAPLRSDPSHPVEIARMRDPQNRLLWRMRIRRLSADQIRDAILAVTGELDLKMGGPSVAASSPRRSVYTKRIRNTQDPLLKAFDAPAGLGSVEQRNVTTTPSQALLMINGDWPLQRATALARRLQREIPGGEPAEIVARAYRLLYGRKPTPEQLATCVAFLQTDPENRETRYEGLTEAMPVRKGRALKVDSSHPPLAMPEADALPEGDFTVEACLLLQSMYEDAKVRTVVSAWDSSSRHRGWSLGVTSKRSSYKPRNLILQFVGDNGDGNRTYEVVPSNIHLQLDRPYFVAASVRLGESGREGVTFYVKDLSSDEPLQTAKAAHQVVSNIRSDAALVIGGRYRQREHRWDGLIDDVRLSRGVLDPEDLLIHAPTVGERTVAFWRFEREPGLLADASGNGLDLSRRSASSDVPPALLDFCHVLLNSNEFLYVE